MKNVKIELCCCADPLSVQLRDSGLPEYILKKFDVLETSRQNLYLAGLFSDREDFRIKGRLYDMIYAELDKVEKVSKST